MYILEGQLVVTAIDSFMSGWGRADTKKNKLVFLCDTIDQAQIVEDNARARSDMKRVSMFTISESMRKAINRSEDGELNLGDFFVQVKTIDSYPNWYKAGYFGDAE